MRKFSVLAVVLALSGCASAPPLVRGLPRNFIDASTNLTERVQTVSPLGSSESALIAELRRQGFEIIPAEHRAEFSRVRFPCLYSWEVRWETDSAGRLTDLAGRADAVCT